LACSHFSHNALAPYTRHNSLYKELALRKASSLQGNTENSDGQTDRQTDRQTDLHRAWFQFWIPLFKPSKNLRT